MPIAAECHSDDHVIEVSFDAEPWFAQASDDQILSLANCGWSGDYPSDDVAIFVAGVNEAVQRLFAYLELVANKKDHPGFDCSVEPQPAIAWLAQQRPQLAARIQSVQDPEPDDAPQQTKDCVCTEPGKQSNKEQYSIDFVYADNGQQFSTGALLTVEEKSTLDAYLLSLKNAGSISDPQVYQPLVTKQSYRSVLKEIQAALKS